MLRWAIIKYHLDWFIFESWQWNCRSVVMIQAQISMRELEHTLWLISWTAQWLWVLIRYGSKRLTPKANKFASYRWARVLDAPGNQSRTPAMFRVCDAGCPTCLVADWPQTWTMNTMMLINCSIVFSILFLRVSILPPNTFRLLRIVASIEREQVQRTLVCHCPSFPLTIKSQRPNQFCQLSLLWFQAFDCIVAHQ